MCWLPTSPRTALEGLEWGAGSRERVKNLRSVQPARPPLPRRTAHDTCWRGMATWRSGDAADCKSAHPGSIPGVASTQSLKILRKPNAAYAEHVTNAERAGTKMGT